MAFMQKEPFFLPQSNNFSSGGIGNNATIKNGPSMDPLSQNKFKKTWESIPMAAKTFIGVTLLFMVFVGMTKMVTDKTPRYDKKMIEGVSKIVKDVFELQKLAQKLSSTDPLLAFEKTILAQGNLSSLKRLMPEQEIVRLTGLNVRSIEKTLDDTHENLRTVLSPMNHDD